MHWENVSFDTSRSPVLIDCGTIREVRLLVWNGEEVFKYTLQTADRLDVLADMKGVEPKEITGGVEEPEYVGAVYNPKKDRYEMVMLTHVGRDEPVWWTVTTSVTDSPMEQDGIDDENGDTVSI